MLLMVGECVGVVDERRMVRVGGREVLMSGWRGPVDGWTRIKQGSRVWPLARFQKARKSDQKADSFSEGIWANERREKF